MASLTPRTATVLLLVTALVLQATAAPAPEPFNLKKTFNKAVKKVTDVVNPTMSCLKKTGAPDAALGYLAECGQTKFYGKFAMASCAGTLNAPSDVKLLLKSSAHCFNLG